MTTALIAAIIKLGEQVKERKDDSPEYKKTVFAIFDAAYKKDKKNDLRTCDQDSMDVFMHAAKLTNDLFFEWHDKTMPQKKHAYKTSSLGRFKFSWDEIYCSASSFLLMSKDDGTGDALSQQGIIRSRRDNILKSLQPFLRWRSDDALIATSFGNLYLLQTSTLLANTSAAYYFLGAFLIANQRKNDAMVKFWFNCIQNHKKNDLILTEHQIIKFNKEGLLHHIIPWAHMIVGEPSEPGETALLRLVHQSLVSNKMPAFKAFIAAAQERKGLDRNNAILKHCFMYAVYNSTIDYIKVFLVGFYGSTLDYSLTSMGLPAPDDNKEDYINLQRSQQRLDHVRIQYLFHAIDYLNKWPFPYQIDNNTKNVIKNIHDDDIQDLGLIVKNVQAFQAAMSWLDSEKKSTSASAPLPEQKEGIPNPLAPLPFAPQFVVEGYGDSDDECHDPVIHTDTMSTVEGSGQDSNEGESPHDLMSTPISASMSSEVDDESDNEEKIDAGNNTFTFFSAKNLKRDMIQHAGKMLIMTADMTDPTMAVGRLQKDSLLNLLGLFYNNKLAAQVNELITKAEADAAMPGEKLEGPGS